MDYKFNKVPSHDEWFKQKAELVTKGFEFPNLPFIEHKGKYVSESFAILAYVASESGHPELLPTQENLTRFLQLNGVISDLASEATGPAYRAKSAEELKGAINDSFKRQGGKLKALATLVQTNKWLLGDNLSILDFKFAEVVERLKDMDKEIGFESYGIDFAPLDAYLQRFLEIPAIKAYRQSNKFSARPYNNFMAFWK